MRTYRNMKSRVRGIQWKKAHLYQNLSILSKEEFYTWSKDNSDFWDLYTSWIKSGYDRKLTPSINRKRTAEGYQLDNMEWITHSENSRLGSLSKLSVGVSLNA